MRNYKLLILGRWTPNRTWDIKDADDCWCQMSISLLEEFKKLSNVTTEIAHIHHPKRDGYKYEDLPQVDCILFNGLPETFSQIDLAKLKEVTKYKKIVTFLERALADSGIDWAFEFKGDGMSNSTFVPGPVNKKLYKVVGKEPKSILLDHTYYNNLNCATHTIENWLVPIKDNYKIYRLIRPDEKEPYIQKFVTPIQETTFDKYLELTDKMETWVCTHPESLGFWLFDAIIRKINVIAPVNFLCKRGLVEHFELKTFSNESEFLNLIKAPIDQNLLQRRIDKMTDYPDIVKIIDKKLRETLLQSELDVIKARTTEITKELEEIKK